MTAALTGACQAGASCWSAWLLVILASRAMILSVSELAEVHWHVPKVVIAATLVALGTSLPELVIGLTSIFKGHRRSWSAT